MTMAMADKINSKEVILFYFKNEIYNYIETWIPYINSIANSTTLSSWQYWSIFLKELIGHFTSTDVSYCLHELTSLTVYKYRYLWFFTGTDISDILHELTSMPKLYSNRHATINSFYCAIDVILFQMLIGQDPCFLLKQMTLPKMRLHYYEIHRQKRAFDQTAHYSLEIIVENGSFCYQGILLNDRNTLSHIVHWKEPTFLKLLWPNLEHECENIMPPLHQDSTWARVEWQEHHDKMIYVAHIDQLLS